MNGALFFADVQPAQRCDASVSQQRDITYIEGLDYDAIPEDDLLDLRLDRTSVLTAEAESRLFQQMNRCYHQAAQLRDAKRDQACAHVEAEIANVLARADELRNLIVVIFHKLTVSIARHFISSRHTLEELVSEGDAALLRSMTLFDPSRGFRFSTYATYAIRRRLARYVTSAEHMHAIPVDFRDSPPIPDRRRWSLPYERAMHAGVEWLETALHELSARERYIIRCRFGWGREFDPRTLQEIADELGVSRERVRQLEAKGIKKLQEIAVGVDIAVM